MLTFTMMPNFPMAHVCGLPITRKRCSMSIPVENLTFTHRGCAQPLVFKQSTTTLVVAVVKPIGVHHLLTISASVQKSPPEKKILTAFF